MKILLFFLFCYHSKRIFYCDKTKIDPKIDIYGGPYLTSAEKNYYLYIQIYDNCRNPLEFQGDLLPRFIFKPFFLSLDGKIEYHPFSKECDFFGKCRYVFSPKTAGKYSLKITTSFADLEPLHGFTTFIRVIPGFYQFSSLQHCIFIQQ